MLHISQEPEKKQAWQKTGSFVGGSFFPLPSTTVSGRCGNARNNRWGWYVRWQTYELHDTRTIIPNTGELLRFHSSNARVFVDVVCIGSSRLTTCFGSTFFCQVLESVVSLRQPPVTRRRLSLPPRYHYPGLRCGEKRLIRAPPSHLLSENPDLHPKTLVSINWIASNLVL